MTGATIARETTAKQLRSYGINSFSDRDPLSALDDYIGNASVTDFVIEQGVLSLIECRGLQITNEISWPLEMVMFDGDFPKFKTELILYCSLKFELAGGNDKENNVSGEETKHFASREET
jgi:hypothetical protein